jgi:hypothetical protein
MFTLSIERKMTITNKLVTPPESQLSFQLVTSERTYHLKANTVDEAEAWTVAVKGCIGSGTHLVNQTLSGSGVPLIVEKCVTFVEAHGMTSDSSFR